MNDDEVTRRRLISLYGNAFGAKWRDRFLGWFQTREEAQAAIESAASLGVPLAQEPGT